MSPFEDCKGKVTHARRGGFTLVEILVVLAIMMGLASIVGVNVFQARAKAKVDQAYVQISQMKSALRVYHVDQGRYPSQAQGLQALIERPTAAPVPARYPAEGYLDGKQVPLDPWSRPYIYLAPGRQGEPFEILSYGEDGEPGGQDRAADISSSFLQQP